MRLMISLIHYKNYLHPLMKLVRNKKFSKNFKLSTKRFNDAGEALQAIESDLTESIDNSINEVNQLLDKIYEVNLQIKRFELLGQGKAVTYRDNRQRLLEDLSKLINFSISPEKVNEEETGFKSLYYRI